MDKIYPQQRKKLSRLVKKYRPKAVGSLSKYLSMPEQEYTEAMAVIAKFDSQDYYYDETLLLVIYNTYFMQAFFFWP